MTTEQQDQTAEAGKTTDRVGKIRRLLALSGSPNKNEAERALAKAMELMAEDRLTLDDVQNAAPEYGHGYVRREVIEGKIVPDHTKFIGGIVSKFFLCKVVLQFEPRRGQRKAIAHIIGRKHEAEIGEHVYLFLRTTYTKLWREYRRAQNEKAEEAAKAARRLEQQIAQVEEKAKEDGVPARTLIMKMELEELRKVKKIGVGDPYAKGTRANYYAGLTLGIKDRLERERMIIEQRMRKNGMALVWVRDNAIDEVAKQIFQQEVPQAAPIQKSQIGSESAMITGYQDGHAVAINPAINGHGAPPDDMTCSPEVGEEGAAEPRANTPQVAHGHLETRIPSSNDTGATPRQEHNDIFGSDDGTFSGSGMFDPHQHEHRAGGHAAPDTGPAGQDHVKSRPYLLPMTEPERLGLVRGFKRFADQQFVTAFSSPHFQALRARVNTLDGDAILDLWPEELAWTLLALASVQQDLFGRMNAVVGGLLRYAAGLAGPNFVATRYPLR